LNGNPILRFLAAVAGINYSHFLSRLEGAADHQAGEGRGYFPATNDETAEEGFRVLGKIEEFPAEKRRFRRSS